jgi:hypothetical protein
VNGQFPKVKPVKIWPKIVQNKRQLTMADVVASSAGLSALAPTRLQRGSPISHQVTMDTMKITTIATTGVAGPNIGTRAAGSGGAASGVLASFSELVVVISLLGRTSAQGRAWTTKKIA